MKSLLASLTVGTTLLAAPAFAADMPVKAPMAPAPVADAWTGFYVGGNVGYEWLHTAPYGVAMDPETLLEFTNFGAALPGALSSQGAEGGAQIGYNWRVHNWVLGFEADIQASDAQAQATALSSVPRFNFTNNAQSTVNLDWFGTARLRAGWLFTPSTLAYATGGFAYGRTVETLNVAVGANGGCGGPGGCTFGGSVAHNNTGWVVGGGLEQLVPSTKISLGLEYLYVQLDGNTFNTACTNAGCLIPPPNGQAVVSTGKLDTQIIRAKLNLHF